MPSLTDKMHWIPEGTFQMGSEDFYPEERPVHRASLDGFWMDEHQVGLGTHHELLESCPTYAEIVESQLTREEAQ